MVCSLYVDGCAYLNRTVPISNVHVLPQFERVQICRVPSGVLRISYIDRQPHIITSPPLLLPTGILEYFSFIRFFLPFFPTSRSAMWTIASTNSSADLTITVAARGSVLSPNVTNVSCYSSSELPKSSPLPFPMVSRSGPVQLQVRKEAIVKQCWRYVLVLHSTYPGYMSMNY